MAEPTEAEWAVILKGRYKPCESEKAIYVRTMARANQPEIYAKYICDGLKEADVPDNLLKMYREAVYGNNQKVKERIHKRMYFLGEKTRYNLVSAHSFVLVRD